MSFKSASAGEFLKLREKAGHLLASQRPALGEVLTVSGWLLESALSGEEGPPKLALEEPSQRDQLLDLVSDLRRVAMRLAAEEEPQQLHAELEEHVSDLEQRSRELHRETRRTPLELLTALWVLETRLHTVHLVLEARRQAPPDALLADTSRLIAWTERLVARTGARLEAGTGRPETGTTAGLDSLELADVAVQLAGVRRDLAAVRRGLALERARETLAGADRATLAVRLELLLEEAGARSVLDASTAGATVPEAIIGQLRDGLESELAALEPPVRDEALRRCSRRLGEWADEVLAAAEERRPPESVSLLQSALSLTEWLLATGSRLAPREPHALQELRKLGRRRRALGDQLLEGRLQLRLRTRFGPARVEAAQRLVLGLILVLMGILGLDVLFGSAPGWRRALDLLDGGICLILLLELAVRMAFSGRPLHYLRRHWLLEALPALPFGLVTGALPSLTPGAWLPLLRGAELARPALWIARLGIFLLRGADRLASRMRGVLQPNIVLFEPLAADPDQRDLGPSVIRLRAKNLLRTRFACAAVSPSEMTALLGRVLAELLRRPRLALERRSASPALAPESYAREIRFETLVEHLDQLRAEEVEDLLGGPKADRLARYLRHLDLPLVRSLPLLRHLVVRRHEDKPYAAIARAGKALGRSASRIASLVYWLADLKGLVTGPALLDRVGFLLVGYTKRPAKRLLMFGLAFLLIKLLLELLFLRLQPLESAQGLLSRSLGVGLIAVGTVCLGIMGIGIWLRRIAGEATDVYRNLVEAQHSNLLETRKEATRGRDLELIERRVLRAESLLRPEIQGCLPEGSALDRLFLPGMLRAGHGPAPALRDLERLGRLYRDFVDGSVLHATNTKIVEQLLGNLVLTSVRLERLAYGRKELKRLEALEVKGGRALLGPHMWFRLVTNSIAEQTAKLILEFNRYCIPLEDRERARPEDLAEMRRWMQRLQGRSAGAQRQDVDRERRRIDHFQTLSFNALHLLSDEPSRDAEVAEEFGEEVCLCLQLARKTMIRRIFGSYPLRALPRPTRTLNLYGFYRRRLSGGRLLLLPLYVLFVAASVIPRLFLLVAATVRDILDPTFLPEAMIPLDSSLPTARRKIDRMRRPIFLETMRLRAEFDPEYLGIVLPGLPAPPTGFGTCEEDLEFLGATGEERAFFDNLRGKRRESISRLSAFLVERGILLRLGTLYTLAPAVGLDAVRALGVAWLADYRGLTRLFDAESRIDAIADPEGLRTELQPLLGFVGSLRLWAARAARSFLRLRRDPFERAWSDYERARGWDKLDPVTRRLRKLAYFRDHRGMRGLVSELLARGAAGRAAAEGQRLVQEICEHPAPWNTQLLTVRTVQVLGVLDLLHLREAVEGLGRYHEVPAREPASRPPDPSLRPELLEPASPPSEAPALAADPR